MDSLPASSSVTTNTLPARPLFSMPATSSAWSTGLAAAGLFLILVALVLLSGCADRVTLIPNSDPALRKTPAEFAADAAKRFPYKAEAPRGGEAGGRAVYDYQLDLIQITNISQDDWENVEVWVNKKYVVFLPKVEKNAKTATTLNFGLLFDDMGHTFPTNNIPKENQISSVEILRDGKIYDLRVAPAD